MSRAVLTLPNLITSARLALVPVFVWALLARRDLSGFFLLVVIGATDWVDGFVARRTGQVSALGKVLDPMVDRIAIIAALVALTVRGAVHPVLAGVILARDLIVGAAFVAMEARKASRIPVNLVGKAATSAVYAGTALAAGSLVLAAGVAPAVRISSERAQVLSTALLIVGAVLYWAAGLLYLGQVRRLVRRQTAGPE